MSERITVSCVRCGERIADAARPLAPDGLPHERDVENPERHRYRIAFFDELPGLRPVGVPSFHWSWVEGMAWQRAWCRRCERHLGWRFSRRDEVLDAVIVERVTRAAAEPADDAPPEADPS